VAQRTIPEKQRDHPRRSESLKSRIFTCVQNNKKRLSLHRVALREIKLQVDDDYDDKDGNE
jgi:ribosomal protein L18